jgi:hypothetical protein
MNEEFHLKKIFRYISTFFDNWIDKIVPTVNYMKMKVMSYNTIDISTCIHGNNIQDFQCYSIETKCYFPAANNTNLNNTLILLRL